MKYREKKSNNSLLCLLKSTRLGTSFQKLNSRCVEYISELMMDNGKNGNCGILSVHVIMHTKTTRDKLSVSAVYSGNRARETHKPLASIGNCFKPEGRCDSQTISH